MDHVEPEERVLWALRRAFQTVEAVKEQRLRATGLTGPYYGVLMNVAVTPGLIGAELARRLHVTPQNVAGLVAKLEARGLLERRSPPARPHVLELHLTPQGRSVLRRAETVVDGVERDVLALLDKQTARRLRAALDAVTDGLG